MNFLIDWGLNAIDTIFSTKSVGATDANCPPQTYPAGYLMDSYGKWQPLCLSLLSVEDSEDLYIFGLMMGGFLLLGTVGVLAYREIRKMVAVQPGQPRMPVMIMEIGRHVQEQTRKLDFIAARPAPRGWGIDFRGGYKLSLLGLKESFSWIYSDPRSPQNSGAVVCTGSGGHAALNWSSFPWNPYPPSHPPFICVLKLSLPPAGAAIPRNITHAHYPTSGRGRWRTLTFSLPVVYGLLISRDTRTLFFAFHRDKENNNSTTSTAQETLWPKRPRSIKLITPCTTSVSLTISLPPLPCKAWKHVLSLLSCFLQIHELVMTCL